MTGLGASAVERLRGLLAKATPRPWRHYNQVFRPQISSRRITEIQTARGKEIVCWPGFDGLPDATAKKSNANAALIVEAVNALPALLDLIDTLTAERDAALAALQEPTNAE